MSDNLLNPLPEQGEKEAHLLDYLHVVQRRWKIALVVFLLVFAVVAIKTFLETPVYQATATLRIGSEAGHLAGSSRKAQRALLQHGIRASGLELFQGR